MERFVEDLLLGLRWLLTPLYLALLAAVLAIYAMVGRELWHLAEDIMTIEDTKLVTLLCSVLDLVLLANLLVMVAVSSHESYVSRFSTAGGNKPEWLGKLDSGNVKVKVAVSVSMIAVIHLLREYLEDAPADRLEVLSGVTLVFMLCTLAIALVDRTARHVEASHD